MVSTVGLEHQYHACAGLTCPRGVSSRDSIDNLYPSSAEGESQDHPHLTQHYKTPSGWQNTYCNGTAISTQMIILNHSSATCIMAISKPSSMSRRAWIVKHPRFAFQVCCAFFLQEWLMRDASRKSSPSRALEPRGSTFVLAIRENIRQAIPKHFVWSGNADI